MSHKSEGGHSETTLRLQNSGEIEQQQLNQKLEELWIWNQGELTRLESEPITYNTEIRLHTIRAEIAEELGAILGRKVPLGEFQHSALVQSINRVQTRIQAREAALRIDLFAEEPALLADDQAPSAEGVFVLPEVTSVLTDHYSEEIPALGDPHVQSDYQIIRAGIKDLGGDAAQPESRENLLRRAATSINNRIRSLGLMLLSPNRREDERFQIMGRARLTVLKAQLAQIKKDLTLFEVKAKK